MLMTSIGVHTHEMHRMQRVRLSVEVWAHLDEVLHDKLGNTVCYDEICAQVREFAGQGHVQLVETFADQVIAICFANERVSEVTVTVEKLDVYEDAESVGVTMTANRAQPHSTLRHSGRNV